MLNYKRRKRQANENSSIVIERFRASIEKEENLYTGRFCIRNEQELLQLLEAIRDELQTKASQLSPDWSIPILLEAIGSMYYGKHREQMKYGPFFKRALAYLWKAGFDRGDERRNLDGLLDVLKLSYVIEVLYGFRRFFLIDNEFSFVVEDGYVRYDDKYTRMIMNFSTLVQGRGKRMRIAAVNSRLMNGEILSFSRALTDVLSGVDPPNINVFKGTFYEKVPGVANPECKKFWQGIFARYSLYLSSMVEESKRGIEFEPSVMLFPEYVVALPEGFCTQETVKDIFWNREWLEMQDDETYSNLIVERPIMRITPNGDFATCSVLIGDSINNFIESHILDYSSRMPKIKLPPSVFKEAISAPFEDKVIESLREMNFQAGHVTEKGIWLIQTGAVNLNWTEKQAVYGEVDVLAYDSEMNLAILVECKVINDIRDYKSYKNIISKLSDNSEGYYDKLLKKKEWIDPALSKKYNKEVSAVSIILTDIPIPVINIPDRGVVLTDYGEFMGTLLGIIGKGK